MVHMDLHRLRLLLELSRRGSMRAVAEELGYTTSSVSEQLAVLTREAGTPLTERDGRRVRLTPAGRRLADHAVTILAAVDAARADLDLPLVYDYDLAPRALDPVLAATPLWTAHWGLAVPGKGRAPARALTSP